MNTQKNRFIETIKLSGTAAEVFGQWPGFLLDVVIKPDDNTRVTKHARGAALHVCVTHGSMRYDMLISDGQRGIEAVVNDLTDLGKIIDIDQDKALAWVVNRGQPAVHEIAPGTLKGRRCSGTYFGSGSYSAAWLASGGATIGGAVDHDNGFARYTETEVTLQPGDWLLSYSSAYPGGRHNILYVCGN